jgi:hypothetical protein
MPAFMPARIVIRLIVGGCHPTENEPRLDAIIFQPADLGQTT